MTIESNEQNKIEIDFFKPSDADAVFELRLAGRKTDPHIFWTSYEEEASKTPEQRREWLEGALRENPTRIIVLAKNKNMPIGMISASTETESVWRLHSVYVRPEFRRRHIGDNMMRTIIARIREQAGAQRIEFQAETENTPAMELYKKFGFEIVGTSKERMGDGKEYDKSVFRQELDRIQF